MKVIIYFIFGLICLVILVGLVWRLISCRASFPCPTWLGWLVERDNPFSKINRAATIVQNSDIQPGMIVLDAGCGPGRVTIPVAQKVSVTGQVVAMDIQEGMLNQTRKKAQVAHLENVQFLQAALGEKNLEQNKFDRVLLVTVLGEIPNREAALKEIFDSLKPGGILSVTEIIFDPHFRRRDTVRKLAISVDFREKQTFGSWWAYTMLLEKPIV